MEGRSEVLQVGAAERNVLVLHRAWPLVLEECPRFDLENHASTMEILTL